ncbi:hypothetical protein EB796_008896 [Bugula neritina]|uniref:Uncharacterized protein n=1 Tax=Bugula neritina TaxID=10212 RepID=A0A7J7K5B6_BUGNE|nr:hypothetical protein EB796_008896 [Bugula neritina]
MLCTNSKLNCTDFMGLSPFKDQLKVQSLKRCTLSHTRLELTNGTSRKGHRLGEKARKPWNNNIAVFTKPTNT